MTPEQALLTDDPTFWQIQYALKPKKIKREKKRAPKSKNLFHFKVGDQVKLSRMRGAFDKTYDEKWTGEIFSITRRRVKEDIPIYEIKSWNNDRVEGTFYERELQKVIAAEDDVYNIESIIKKRKRGGKTEVLVKWQGWGKEYNTWIDEDEMKDL
jgi:ribosomal protein L21E